MIDLPKFSKEQLGIIGIVLVACLALIFLKYYIIAAFMAAAGIGIVFARRKKPQTTATALDPQSQHQHTPILVSKVLHPHEGWTEQWRCGCGYEELRKI